MKVLYITGPGMGGSNVSLKLTILELQKKGIKPIVVVPNISIAHWFNENSIDTVVINFKFSIWQPHYAMFDKLVLPIRMLKNIAINMVAIVKLLLVMIKVSPDIVHTNISVLTVGYWAARILHIPHVWHIREYINKDFGYTPFPSFKFFSKRFLHEYCISISRDLVEHFHIVSDKIKVIYNGVSTNSIELLPKENRFLFVGALIPGKGIQDAVEGYISYLKMGGSYDLYVVGFGKEKFVNNLKLAIPEKYRMKVHFLGQRNDIYKLMSSSLAIIVPSFFEAFGRVTAEAMLNSCLVIGRNTGGTKEQFDNGFDLCHKEIGLRFTTTKEIAYHLYDIEKKGINFYQEMIKNADYVASHLYAVEKNANNIYSFYKNMKNV